MKLIICAGERLQPGFLTHDIQDLPNIDIKCDFWDLPNHVERDSMDEIHFTHALEHFPADRTYEVLKLIWILLKDGENSIWRYQTTNGTPR
jgi:predicted SAM-dependent methyltransferase